MVEVLVGAYDKIGVCLFGEKRAGHHAFEPDETFDYIGEIRVDVHDLIRTILERKARLAEPIDGEFPGSDLATGNLLREARHSLSSSCRRQKTWQVSRRDPSGSRSAQ